MSGITSLNIGGWTHSDLRAWMSNTLWAALPAELQQVIKPVEKISDFGWQMPSLQKTEDAIWIPSDRELNCEKTGLVLMGQGEPYPIYTDADSRKKSNAGGGVKLYWTRSTGKEGHHYYRYIDSLGYPGNMGAGNTSCGIALGFCI